MAEASGGRTHRRRGDPPPAGFEDRDDHRTACASRRARNRNELSTAERSVFLRADPPPILNIGDPYSYRHACGYFGCGTILIYGLGDFQPPGYCFCASSFETLPLMITSCPGFQFAGVETLCLAVSCIESMTRNISS